MGIVAAVSLNTSMLFDAPWHQFEHQGRGRHGQCSRSFGLMLWNRPNSGEPTIAARARCLMMMIINITAVADPAAIGIDLNKISVASPLKPPVTAKTAHLRRLRSITSLPFLQTTTPHRLVWLDSCTADHGGLRSGLIVRQTLRAFKLHVATLQGPLVARLEEHRAGGPRNGGLIWAFVRRLISAFSGSSGFVEWICLM
jgi:hypothetical protein